MECRESMPPHEPGLKRTFAEPNMVQRLAPRDAHMRQRKYLFPHVIELNYQAGRRLGVNVYLIDGGSEFLLIDIGYLDTVNEIVDLIRQMDFNLSTCKMLIATHADAHHGSNLPDFITSVRRIREDKSEFLLPSHGPVFRRDNRIIEKAIERLTGYQYMADFGTCAIGWPLLDEWEKEVSEGRMPDFN